MREQQNNRQERTIIGLDLGDRWHRFCVLGESGQVVEEGSVANNRVALSELSSRYPGALVVMEAGCHSPWVSRHLKQAGCEVIVSNPRKTRAIYQHERKSDRRDALMLARIARMEPALLYPVRHGSEEAQQDLLRIKLRDSLVRARVGLINSLRFTLKSLGYTIANPSTERFHKVIQSALPESVVQMIAPSMQAIEELSLRIKLLDWEIRTLAHTKYPETSWLEQIPGVGPITALYFVLKIGDPARFERVRDVGAFTGQLGSVYSGTVRSSERFASVRTSARCQRHGPSQKARRSGRGPQTGRAALNSVEKQESLSSVPPAAGKNEDP